MNVTRIRAGRSAPARASTEETDAQLVERALQEPVRPAFRALYERHEGDVYRFLVRLLGDATLAEDVLQETFLSVYRSLASYDPRLAFRPWVFRIARNAGLNALRKQARSRPLEVDVRDPGAPPAARAAEAEDRSVVDRALEALDDEDRALLILRHVFEARVVELAQTYGIGERGLRKRLERAGERLTQALIQLRGGQA